MSYVSKIALYSVSLISMILCDVLWLKYVAYAWYMKELGKWIEQFNSVPAFLFYVCFIFGLHVFVIYMLPVTSSLVSYALHGMLLGLIAYGTYDFTNLATISGWPVLISCVDILWGVFVSGFVTCITVMAGRWWNVL